GAELPVEDIEVVAGDAAFGLRPVEPHAVGLACLLGGAEHPLELLGGDDGHHAVAPIPLGPLQVGADVIKLAVIPARTVGPLQVQDRDAVARGEGVDVPAEAVADLLDHGRRCDRLTEMTTELLDLPADLEV